MTTFQTSTYVVHAGSRDLFTPKFNGKTAEELYLDQLKNLPAPSKDAIERMTPEGSLLIGALVNINSASGEDGKGQRPKFESISTKIKHGTNFITTTQQFVFINGQEDTTVSVTVNNGDGQMIGWGAKLVQHDEKPHCLIATVQEKEQAEVIYKQIIKNGGSAGISTAQADGTENIDLKSLPIRRGEKAIFTVIHKFKTTPGQNATLVHRAGSNSNNCQGSLEVKSSGKPKQSRELLGKNNPVTETTATALQHNNEKDGNGMGMLTVVDADSLKNTSEIIPAEGGNFAISLSGGPTLANISSESVETFSFPSGDSAETTIPSGECTSNTMHLAKIKLGSWVPEEQAKQKRPIVLIFIDTSYSMGAEGMEHGDELLRVLDSQRIADPCGEHTGIIIDEYLTGFSDKIKRQKFDSRMPLETNGGTKYLPMLKAIKRRYDEINDDDEITNPIIAKIFTDGMPWDEDAFKAAMETTSNDPSYDQLAISLTGIGPYVQEENLQRFASFLGANRGNASRVDRLKQAIPELDARGRIQAAKIADDITSDMHHHFIDHITDLAEKCRFVNPRIKFNKETSVLTKDGQKVETDAEGYIEWSIGESELIIAYPEGTMPCIEMAQATQGDQNQEILRAINTAIEGEVGHATTLPVADIYAMNEESAAAMELVQKLEPGISNIVNEQQKKEVILGIVTAGIHVKNFTALVGGTATKINPLPPAIKEAHSKELDEQQAATRRLKNVTQQEKPVRSPAKPHYSSFPEAFFGTDEDYTDTSNHRSFRALKHRSLGAMQPTLADEFSQDPQYRSAFDSGSSQPALQESGGPQGSIWRSMSAAFNDDPGPSGASFDAGAGATNFGTGASAGANTVVAHTFQNIPVNSEKKKDNFKVHDLRTKPVWKQDPAYTIEYTLGFLKDMLFQVALSKTEDTEELIEMLKGRELLGYKQIHTTDLQEQAYADKRDEFVKEYREAQLELAEECKPLIESIFKRYAPGEDIFEFIIEEIDTFYSSLEDAITAKVPSLTQVMTVDCFREFIIKTVENIQDNIECNRMKCDQVTSASDSATATAHDELFAQHEDTDSVGAELNQEPVVPMQHPVTGPSAETNDATLLRMRQEMQQLRAEITSLREERAVSAAPMAAPLWREDEFEIIPEGGSAGAGAGAGVLRNLQADPVSGHAPLGGFFQHGAATQNTTGQGNGTAAGPQVPV